MHDNQAPTPTAESSTTRAALQRRLATAIRVELDAAAACAERHGQAGHVAFIAERIKAAPSHVTFLSSPVVALAAAAIDDELWDALAQVRQVVVLERATTTQPVPRFRCVCGADRTGGTPCSRPHCATRRADR